MIDTNAQTLQQNLHTPDTHGWLPTGCRDELGRPVYLNIRTWEVAVEDSGQNLVPPSLECECRVLHKLNTGEIQVAL